MVQPSSRRRSACKPFAGDSAARGQARQAQTMSPRGTRPPSRPTPLFELRRGLAVALRAKADKPTVARRSFSEGGRSNPDEQPGSSSMSSLARLSFLGRAPGPLAILGVLFLLSSRPGLAQVELAGSWAA